VRQRDKGGIESSFCHSNSDIMIGYAGCNNSVAGTRETTRPMLLLQRPYSVIGS